MRHQLLEQAQPKCRLELQSLLDDLKRRFDERLVPVRLTGDAAADTAAMKRAAPVAIDAVLDFLPPSVPASVARTAVMAVRP